MGQADIAHTEAPKAICCPQRGVTLRMYAEELASIIAMILMKDVTTKLVHLAPYQYAKHLERLGLDLNKVKSKSKKESVNYTGDNQLT